MDFPSPAPALPPPVFPPCAALLCLLVLLLWPSGRAPPSLAHLVFGNETTDLLAARVATSGVRFSGEPTALTFWGSRSGGRFVDSSARSLPAYAKKVQCYSRVQYITHISSTYCTRLEKSSRHTPSGQNGDDDKPLFCPLPSSVVGMGSDPAAATPVYGKGGHQNLGCAVDLYLSGAAGVPDFDRQNMRQNFVSFPPFCL